MVNCGVGRGLRMHMDREDMELSTSNVCSNENVSRRAEACRCNGLWMSYPVGDDAIERVFEMFLIVIDDIFAKENKKELFPIMNRLINIVCEKLQVDHRNDSSMILEFLLVVSCVAIVSRLRAGHSSNCFSQQRKPFTEIS